jgi:hypothetical protein
MSASAGKSFLRQKARLRTHDPDISMSCKISIWSQQAFAPHQVRTEIVTKRGSGTAESQHTLPLQLLLLYSTVPHP